VVTRTRRDVFHDLAALMPMVERLGRRGGARRGGGRSRDCRAALGVRAGVGACAIVVSRIKS
jgi:hypothetical protein